MMLHPRHRADCSEFFDGLHQNTKRVDFKAPDDVISEIGLAAARAGRTWNDQLGYIAELFLGRRPPDFDDARSEEDWRTLLSPSMLWIPEAGGWIPFAGLGRRAP